MLVDLAKPDFIREDEEFQKLQQYLIIEGHTNCKKFIKYL